MWHAWGQPGSCSQSKACPWPGYTNSWGHLKAQRAPTCRPVLVPPTQPPAMTAHASALLARAGAVLCGPPCMQLLLYLQMEPSMGGSPSHAVEWQTSHLLLLLVSYAGSAGMTTVNGWGMARCKHPILLWSATVPAAFDRPAL